MTFVPHRLLSLALLLASLVLPSLALAQTVTSVAVNKVRHFLQTSATTVGTAPASYCDRCPFEFLSIVAGSNMASIPAPILSGPIDSVGLGSAWNNGRFVYAAWDGNWHFGSENDWRALTEGELDARFGSGVYTVDVNGSSVSVNLAGTITYPNTPVLTLTGGAWVDGKYVIDPSHTLTISTNTFSTFGANPADTIFLQAFGVAFAQANASNSLSLTVPAGTLSTGKEYQVVGTFVSSADWKNPSAFPGSNANASYLSNTWVTVKADSAPPPQVFPMTVTSNITPTSVNVQATFEPRPEDVGTTQSVFVFFVAPSNLVEGASLAKNAVTHIAPKNVPKDSAPVQCVLAQLSAGGTLAAVTPSTMVPLLTDLFGAQARTVTMLQNVQPDKIAGATSMLGYGGDGPSMYDSGRNQSAVTIPGTVTCRPERPQKGWWWNPKEDGRGYSIETVANHFFFASFLYDVSGRASWYVATGDGATLDGSLISQRPLLSVRGGQTLGGAYPGKPTISTAGEVTIAFSDASNGTLVWPGGAVPIQRFNIVTNGTRLDPLPGQPESGWWWNPDEDGRGFFLEWQGGVLDIAGYMYDENGDPIWYLSENLTPSTNPQQFASNWWQYADGMTLAGPWKPNRQVSDHVAPVTITFQAADAALMTLPNGRTTRLVRQRF